MNKYGFTCINDGGYQAASKKYISVCSLRFGKKSLLAALLAVAVGVYLLPSPIDPKPHVYVWNTDPEMADVLAAKMGFYNRYRVKFPHTFISFPSIGCLSLDWPLEGAVVSCMMGCVSSVWPSTWEGMIYLWSLDWRGLLRHSRARWPSTPACRRAAGCSRVNYADQNPSLLMRRVSVPRYQQS